MSFAFVFVPLVLGAVLLTGHASAADGARLFGSSDIIAAAKESTSLSSDQQKALRHFRRMTDLHKNVMVVKLNRAALDSGLLTLLTPDGKEFQYVGSRKKNEHDGSYSWDGKSKYGTLGISYSANSLFGEVREDGKLYHIMALDGSIYIISEAPYNALSEPPSMSGGTDPPELFQINGLSPRSNSAK